MKKFKIIFLLSIISLFLVGCSKKKELNSYNITFDTDGGSIVETQVVKSGNLIKEPIVPIKEGYTFVGWYIDNELFDFNTKVFSNIKLIAHWESVANSELTDTENSNIDFSLNKTNVTLYEGESVFINVTTSSQKNVIWKSNNEKIAIVENGKITAKSAGSTTIIVLIDKVSKIVNVTVLKASTTTTNKNETSDVNVVNQEENSINNSVTTTKPTTTTSTTTTKSITTSAVTTTKKIDNISYKMVKLQGDTSGQVILYIIKNNQIVSGTCDITTNSGVTVTKDISTSGYVTNENIIKSITNIKVN